MVQVSRVLTGMAMAMAMLGLSMPQASIAKADEAELPPAPLSQEQPEEGVSHYSATSYTQTMWDGGLIGQDTLLRRAKMDGEPHMIWRLTDIAIASRFESEDQPKVWTQVILDIGPDGRVALCTMDEGRNNDRVLAAQICPVIKERTRFSPALDLLGRPAVDQISFRLNFNHRKQYGEQAPRAFQPILMAPAPYPAPDATQSSEWPILRDGPPRFATTSSQTRVPLAPVRLTSPDESIAGIAFSRTKDDVSACEVVVPSGDAGLDSGACDFMETTYGPRLSLPRYGKETMPYLVIGAGKPERAVAPATGLAARGKPDADSVSLTHDRLESAFQAVGGKLDDLSFALSLDEAGKPTDCRIRASSGSDAGDLKACEIVKETLRYTPAIDIFGRPSMVRWQGWYAKRG